MKTMLTALLVVAALIMSEAASDGAVFHVTPVGNDANSGLSWIAALRTITAATSKATAGDEIWVAAGTYRQCVTVKSGVACIGGFAGNETSVTQRNWQVNRAVVCGVKGDKTENIFGVQSGNSSTRIDGFEIANGSKGINMTASSVQILNNKFTNNTVGVYSHNSSPLVANNVMAGCAIGVNAVLGGAPSIINNTMVGSDNTGKGIFISSPAGGFIFNNIIVSFAYGIESGYTSAINDFNCLSNAANYTSTTAGGPNNIHADPRFADTQHHLSVNSPAIDAGLNSKVEAGWTDWDNWKNAVSDRRISGAKVDMGADEWITPSGMVKAPILTPVGGVYAGSVSVTMQSETTGAEIFYTLDGSEPSRSATSYSGSIILTNSTTIKAIAYKDPLQPSRITSENYAVGKLYFVKPAGNDTNDGRSWITACRTFAGAMGKATAGDAIWVGAGEYAETVVMKSGVALYGGFQGIASEISLNQRNWTLYKARVKGRLGDKTENIFGVQNGNSSTRIDGFEIANGYKGVNMTASSVQILNNKFTNNRVGVYSHNSSPLVANNVMDGCEIGVNVVIGGAPSIINNTMVGSDNAGKGIFISAPSGGFVFNNIIASFGLGIYADYTSAVNDYNCLSNTDNYSSSTLGGPNNIHDDPLFADAQYHLSVNSPAVDAGLNSKAQAGWADWDNWKDAVSDLRISGARVDIGADEYTGVESDDDADGMPDTWEMQHFGSTNNPSGNASADPDGDGLSNLHEYMAGTDPTNAASVLIVTSGERQSDNMVIAWQSAADKFYVVQKATNLLTGFVEEASHIPATPPVNTYTASVNKAGCFYRIRLE